MDVLNVEYIIIDVLEVEYRTIDVLEVRLSPTCTV